MAVSLTDCEEFDQLISRHFAFLETRGFAVHEARRVDAEMHDAGVAKRYESPDLRLDIGWSAFEQSLSILLKFDRPQLPGQLRRAYFEPLVEFLSDGVDAPIVPQVRHRMDETELMRLMEQRSFIFESGLEPVAARLAEKLDGQLREIRSLADERILAYHDWIAN
ncbi:MAG: hypothetical protein R3C30_05960 [Hyphomonadaceae bacterium]